MSTATLEVTTPSDREIALIRVFNAPRKLVFDCFTKPELLKRWGLGPRAWTLTGCDIDLRVGGRPGASTMTKNTGEVMVMSGVYLEIVAPERIVCKPKGSSSPGIPASRTQHIHLRQSPTGGRPRSPSPASTIRKETSRHRSSNPAWKAAHPSATTAWPNSCRRRPSPRRPHNEAASPTALAAHVSRPRRTSRDRSADARY